LDIGCGAGYFVSALNKLKVKKIYGYDPSISMTKYGNKINNFKKLNYLSINQTLEIIKNTSFSECCVTMIGTLEHIYNSHKILSEIKKNKNIKYFYISVPCYSPSTFIELIFNTNFQRLMAPQHTHVFTDKSIRYMAKKYKFKIISEWWFGTDILDLFRNFIIEIYKKKILNDEYFLFNKMFSEILDNMQLEIDKKKLSSEAHIIFKVNN
jgi:2-polyprenyl-3-methyl-5-hydroxy-6-metoxy-1,4-benzoquinol methylase